MRVNLGRIEKKSFDKNLNGKFKKLNNGMVSKICVKKEEVIISIFRVGVS